MECLQWRNYGRIYSVHPSMLRKEYEMNITTKCQRTASFQQQLDKQILR